MAAPLNPNQLRMFMQASELRGMDSIDVAQDPSSRFGMNRPKEEMWATKKRENRWDRHGPEWLADGVREPVTLGSGSDVKGDVIVDGHHRIQSAGEHHPNSYLPVQHMSIDDKFGKGYSGADDGWDD